MAKRMKMVHSSYSTFFAAWGERPMTEGKCRGRASFVGGVFRSYSTVIGRYFPTLGVYLSTTCKYSPTTSGQQYAAENAIRARQKATIIRVAHIYGDSPTAHQDNEAEMRYQYASLLTRKYAHGSSSEEYYLKQDALLAALQNVCVTMRAYSDAFSLAWVIPDAETDAKRIIDAHFDPARQERLAKSRARAQKLRERKMMIEMVRGERPMGDVRRRRWVFGREMVLTEGGYWQDVA